MSKEEITQKLKYISTLLDTDVYAVGGPVRDLLLGKKPNDLDIASPLTPEEVIKQAKKRGIRVEPTGIEYGTVTLLINGEPIEHTTFRKEQYRDDRHPEVKYTKNIEEDLKRRDFTINAMAMDKNGNIIDPFGGKQDIKKGIIRAVGDPHERFYEDPLRIMRAARFSARYGFSIDTETFFAARNYTEHLDPDNPNRRVAPERVMMEIRKALKQAQKPGEYFKTLRGLGVDKKVFKNTLAKTHDVPQQPKYHKHDVYTHSIEVVNMTKEYMKVDEKIVERTKQIYHKYKKEYKKYQKQITPLKENLIINNQKPTNVPPPPSLYDMLENEFGDIIKKNLEASIMKALVEAEYNKKVDYNENLLLAAALHDVGKGIIWEENGPEMVTNKWHYSCHDKRGYIAVREELRRLKASRTTIEEVSRLVLAHDIGGSPKSIYKYLRFITTGKKYDLIAKAAILRKADAMSHRNPNPEDYRNLVRELVDTIATRPLNGRGLNIDHSDVYKIVKKYYNVDDKTAHVIAGEITRRLEYDTYHMIQNHKIDLLWRAEQLARSGYRETKKYYQLTIK